MKLDRCEVCGEMATESCGCDEKHKLCPECKRKEATAKLLAQWKWLLCLRPPGVRA